MCHRGVLFLDEFPEFGRQSLEALRQPLEDGDITITRAAYSVNMPARLMLIAAMNPSPSGFAEQGSDSGTFSAEAARRYRQRISGPLLDRIDVHVEVPRIPYQKMAAKPDADTSAHVRARVAAARDRQRERLAAHDLHVNAEIPARLVPELCELEDTAESLLRSAHDRMELSGRGHHRILKLGRTIADLAGDEIISPESLAEALQYRPRLEL